VRSIRRGAFDCLAKPFDDVIRVRNTVGRALERVTLVRRNRELERALALPEGAPAPEVGPGGALNCGCPSDRVREGRFGACLMDEPERVADIVAAMQSSVAVPVTVKCRIGIEPTASALDDYDYLVDFVAAVARRGCRTFIVHARKAILSGLSPKQNREVPPLRHEIVRRLKADFPELEIVLNGGVRSVAEVRSHLDALDGVMIGREAYQNPYLLTDLHTAIVDRYFASPTREAVVRAYLPYVASQFERGVRQNALTRPLLGLYFGQQGARAWRRYLSEQSRTCPDPRFLLDSLRLVAAAA
jgi:tRNA-dihydrouridine synthase A